MTTLSKIKFDADSINFANSFGFQETDKDGKLLHLYDESGEQLDSGNGYFPNATWEFVEKCGDMFDSDDFWNLIAEFGEA